MGLMASRKKKRSGSVKPDEAKQTSPNSKNLGNSRNTVRQGKAAVNVKNEAEVKIKTTSKTNKPKSLKTKSRNYKSIIRKQSPVKQKPKPSSTKNSKVESSTCKQALQSTPQKSKTKSEAKSVAKQQASKIQIVEAQSENSKSKSSHRGRSTSRKGVAKNCNSESLDPKPDLEIEQLKTKAENRKTKSLNSERNVQTEKLNVNTENFKTSPLYCEQNEKTQKLKDKNTKNRSFESVTSKHDTKTQCTNSSKTESCPSNTAKLKQDAKAKPLRTYSIRTRSTLIVSDHDCSDIEHSNSSGHKDSEQHPDTTEDQEFELESVMTHNEACATNESETNTRLEKSVNETTDDIDRSSNSSIEMMWNSFGDIERSEDSESLESEQLDNYEGFGTNHYSPMLFLRYSRANDEAEVLEESDSEDVNVTRSNSKEDAFDDTVSSAVSNGSVALVKTSRLDCSAKENVQVVEIDSTIASDVNVNESNSLSKSLETIENRECSLSNLKDTTFKKTRSKSSTAKEMENKNSDIESVIHDCSENSIVEVHSTNASVGRSTRLSINKSLVKLKRRPETTLQNQTVMAEYSETTLEGTVGGKFDSLISGSEGTPLQSELDSTPGKSSSVKRMETNLESEPDCTSKKQQNMKRSLRSGIKNACETSLQLRKELCNVKETLLGDTNIRYRRKSNCLPKTQERMKRTLRSAIQKDGCETSLEQNKELSSNNKNLSGDKDISCQSQEDFVPKEQQGMQRISSSGKNNECKASVEPNNELLNEEVNLFGDKDVSCRSQIQADSLPKKRERKKQTRSSEAKKIACEALLTLSEDLSNKNLFVAKYVSCQSEADSSPKKRERTRSRSSGIKNSACETDIQLTTAEFSNNSVNIFENRDASVSCQSETKSLSKKRNSRRRTRRSDIRARVNEKSSTDGVFETNIQGTLNDKEDIGEEREVGGQATEQVLEDLEVSRAAKVEGRSKHCKKNSSTGRKSLAHLSFENCKSSNSILEAMLVAPDLAVLNQYLTYVDEDIISSNPVTCQNVSVSDSSSKIPMVKPIFECCISPLKNESLPLAHSPKCVEHMDQIFRADILQLAERYNRSAGLPSKSSVKIQKRDRRKQEDRSVQSSSKSSQPLQVANLSSKDKVNKKTRSRKANIFTLDKKSDSLETEERGKTVVLNSLTEEKMESAQSLNSSCKDNPKIWYWGEADILLNSKCEVNLRIINLTSELSLLKECSKNMPLPTISKESEETDRSEPSSSKETLQKSDHLKSPELSGLDHVDISARNSDKGEAVNVGKLSNTNSSEEINDSAKSMSTAEEVEEAEQTSKCVLPCAKEKEGWPKMKRSKKNTLAKKSVSKRYGLQKKKLCLKSLSSSHEIIENRHKQLKNVDKQMLDIVSENNNSDQSMKSPDSKTKQQAPRASSSGEDLPLSIQVSSADSVSEQETNKTFTNDSDVPKKKISRSGKIMVVKMKNNLKSKLDSLAERGNSCVSSEDNFGRTKINRRKSEAPLVAKSPRTKLKLLGKVRRVSTGAVSEQKSGNSFVDDSNEVSRNEKSHSSKNIVAKSKENLQTKRDSVFEGSDNCFSSEDSIDGTKLPLVKRRKIESLSVVNSSKKKSKLLEIVQRASGDTDLEKHSDNSLVKLSNESSKKKNLSLEKNLQSKCDSLFEGNDSCFSSDESIDQSKSPVGKRRKLESASVAKPPRKKSKLLEQTFTESDNQNTLDTAESIEPTELTAETEDEYSAKQKKFETEMHLKENWKKMFMSTHLNSPESPSATSSPKKKEKLSKDHAKLLSSPFKNDALKMKITLHNAQSPAFNQKRSVTTVSAPQEKPSSSNSKSAMRKNDVCSTKSTFEADTSLAIFAEDSTIKQGKSFGTNSGTATVEPETEKGSSLADVLNTYVDEDLLDYEPDLEIESQPVDTLFSDSDSDSDTESYRKKMFARKHQENSFNEGSLLVNESAAEEVPECQVTSSYGNESFPLVIDEKDPVTPFRCHTPPLDSSYFEKTNEMAKHNSNIDRLISENISQNIELTQDSKLSTKDGLVGPVGEDDVPDNASLTSGSTSSSQKDFPRGFCFTFLDTGQCLRKNCHFRHEYPPGTKKATLGPVGEDDVPDSASLTSGSTSSSLKDFPRGFCFTFLDTGQCLRKNCHFRHEYPPGTKKEFNLDDFEKLCKEGLLNKAVDCLEKIPKNYNGDSKMRILTIFMETVVSLHQVNKLKNVGSFIEQHDLCHTGFLSEMVLCSSQINGSLDFFIQIIRYCEYHRLSLTSRAVKVMDRAVQLGDHPLWKLVTVLYFIVVTCRYQPTAELLKRVLANVSTHPSQAQKTFRILNILSEDVWCDLDQDDLMKLLDVLQSDPKSTEEAMQLEKQLASMRIDSMIQHPAKWVKSAIEGGRWGEVATQFRNYGSGHTNTQLIVQIHEVLCLEGALSGECFGQLVYAITDDKKIRLPSHLYQLLGQIGTALLMENHHEKRFKSAFAILRTMHAYNLDYYRLQKPAVTQQGYFPYSTMVTPCRAALVAVETCLEVQEFQSALVVFECFDWVKTSNQIFTNIIYEEILWRARLLKTLAENLLQPELLDKGIVVLKHLFTTISEDLTDKSLKLSPQILDVNTLFCDYTRTVIQNERIGSALDLIEYYKKMGVMLSLSKNVLRSLLILCQSSGKVEEAKKLFSWLSCMGIYSVTKPSVQSHCLRVKSDLSIEEITLHLEAFLKELFKVICFQTNSVFEEHFAFSIAIIASSASEEDSEMLGDVSLAIADTFERIVFVLGNSVTPALKVLKTPSTDMIVITPNSVYQYFIQNEKVFQHLVASPVSPKKDLTLLQPRRRAKRGRGKKFKKGKKKALTVQNDIQHQLLNSSFSQAASVQGTPLQLATNSANQHQMLLASQPRTVFPSQFVNRNVTTPQNLSFASTSNVTPTRRTPPSATVPRPIVTQNVSYDIAIGSNGSAVNQNAAKVFISGALNRIQQQQQPTYAVNLFAGAVSKMKQHPLNIQAVAKPFVGCGAVRKQQPPNVQVQNKMPQKKTLQPVKKKLAPTSIGSCNADVLNKVVSFLKSRLLQKRCTNVDERAQTLAIDFLRSRPHLSSLDKSAMKHLHDYSVIKII